MLPARPERQPPSPPLPFLGLDGSPVRSVGCDWSGGRQSYRTSSLLHTPQDQCRLQTRTPKVPATQRQRSQNPRSLRLAGSVSRDPVGSSFEMLRLLVLSPLGHYLQGDIDRAT